MYATRWREHGWCLTIVNVFQVGLPWHAMSITQNMWKSWQLHMWHATKGCGVSSFYVEGFYKSHEGKRSSRGSWLIVPKPIGMLFTLCLAHQKTFPNHCTTKKKLVFSIGFSPWKCTPISSFRCHICVKTNGNWQQLQKFQNTWWRKCQLWGYKVLVAFV